MERNGNHYASSLNGNGNGTDVDTSLPKLVDNSDLIWEQNYKRIEKLQPLFRHLPSSQQQVAKVVGISQGTLSMKGYGNNYVGPLVLAKNVSAEKFEEWLRQEWGLHKSTRLVTGTVYTPQACAKDHGRLRQAFGNRDVFPILAGLPPPIVTGSGKEGDKNPDVFWHRPHQAPSVVIEVGVSQSLPSLRERAFRFCADTHSWGGLVYVVLVKRFQNRLYVEVWRRVPPQPADNVGALAGNLADPAISNLTLGGTMQFVGAANATGPGFQPQFVPAYYQWQLGLPNNCNLPAGNEILAAGPAVPIDANVLLQYFCEFDD